MTLWKMCLLDLEVNGGSARFGVTFRMFVMLEHVLNDTSRVHLRTSFQVILCSGIHTSGREQLRTRVQAILDRNRVSLDPFGMRAGQHNLWPTCDPMALKGDVLRTFQDYYLMSARAIQKDPHPATTEDIIRMANVKSVLLSHYLMTSRSLPPDRPEEATLPTFVNDVNIMDSIEALCHNQGWLTTITEALDLPIICTWDAP